MLSVKTWGAYIFFTTTEGGVEQFEDTKKPNISKLSLYCCCSSHFFWAFAQVLRKQERNGYGAAGSGGHSRWNGA
jgi:hypothetical protein